MSKREIWLVGPYLEVIPCSKLPSKRQVMGYLMNCKDRKHMPVKASLKETAEEVVKLWNKARIPTKRLDHIEEKMKKLFTEYNLLKKNRNNAAKRSAALQQKESLFDLNLNQLFDIAHTDAES